MMNRRRRGAGGLGIVIALAIAGAIGYFFYSRNAAEEAPQAPKEAEAPAKTQELPPAFVRVETARADHVVRESIVQNTSIEAVDRVKMTPRVTGRLERLHVKQGDKVKTGDLIATLEHAQQDALIGSTEAQVASARADTEKARAELENAKTDLERYERLVKEGFSTQQQYDSIQTTFVSKRASYAAAQARERQVAAELGRVRSTKNDYIMLSPLDGTVLTDYSLTAGEMISPSSPIVDIADLRTLKASVRVPEQKIFAVRPGMDVFLRFDALPNEEFRGEVSRIDQFVDPASRTSAVEIALDNESTGGRLRPGMFGTASIVEREHTSAIVIPDTAIHRGDKIDRVFVVEDGVARAREVTLGVAQNGTTQITSGLVSGDAVIVFGGANLKDGDKVTVQ